MRKLLVGIISFSMLVATFTACSGNISVGSPGEQAAQEEKETSISQKETPVSQKEIEKKEVPIYIFSMEEPGSFPIYFIKGGVIPYVEINDAAAFFENMMHYLGAGYTGDGKHFELSVEADGDTVKVTREDGYYMTVDCEKDTLGFLDYNAFLRAGDESLLDPAVFSNLKQEDGVEYYIRRSDETNTRYGHEMVMDAGKYNINFVREGENYYLPLQTVSDILFAPRNMSILFNGENIYLCDGYLGSIPDGLTPLGESYYSVEAAGTVDSELSEFSYNELCFAFDHLYGLKDVHGIESFDMLASDSGYKGILLGTDAVAIDKVYHDIVYRYLDDKHSKYIFPSYLSGADAAKDFGKDIGEGIARNEMNATIAEINNVRAKYYPNGIPAYEEIGDTAYITFDSFMGDSMDYYKEAPTADAPDTIGLISYAVGRILRDGSPVKRVVLDLSGNTGGESMSAVYTLAAFLGKAQISVENSLTEARETCVFYSDTNLDHEFDESDTLDGKGLQIFCLTSPVSFSCGNLVPCFFKSSGKVTIIGKQSGGGSCSSMYLSTASGSMIRISSFNRLSFLKNGAFYDIDQGAPVDYTIIDYDHYYDRKALNQFMDGLF